MKIILVLLLSGWTFLGVGNVFAQENGSAIYQQARDLLKKGYRMEPLRMSTRLEDGTQCMNLMHEYREKAQDLRQQAQDLFDKTQDLNKLHLGTATVNLLTCVTCSTQATEYCLRTEIDLIKYRNPGLKE